MAQQITIPEQMSLNLKGTSVALLLNLLQEAPYRVAQPVIEEIMAQLRAPEIKSDA